MKCYKAYCQINSIYERGSTGGVVTGLAHYLLDANMVKGILVSKRYQTVIASTHQELERSQGSIYEDFRYNHPLINRSEYAQVGKPCDISNDFKICISLFCSGVLQRRSIPVTKDDLQQRSVLSRYLLTRLRRPDKCKHCSNHVGRYADISVGDSQYDKKLSHVMVWTRIGECVWNDAITQGYIHAKQILFASIRDNQPYLFGSTSPQWRIKRLWRG